MKKRIRRRLRNARALLAAFLLLLGVDRVVAQQPVQLPAPLLFIRVPREPNTYLHTPSVSEANGPSQNHPKAELCIRKLDGTIVKLLDKVIDYSVSLDGKSLRVAQEVSRRSVNGLVRGTDRVVRIDDPAGVPKIIELIPPREDVSLAFPLEVPDGLAYLSDQDNWKNPHEFYPALTIYRAEANGTHRERIGHFQFGGAFGMSFGKAGRLLYASGENQGFRSGLGHMWSIFSIGTHGEDFAPEASSTGMMGSADPFDFPIQTSDGSLLWTQYYDTRDRGTIWVAPAILAENFQTSPTHFGDPLPSNNPRLVLQWINKIGLQLGHQRRGMYQLVERTHYIDHNNGADDVGLVDHPRAIPGNGVLIDWTGPGDWNNNDLRICLVADIKKKVASPTDLVVVQNDPNYHEYMGSLLVSYKEIYGHEPPTPALKVADGTPYKEGVENSPKRPYLPPGSAYSVIGSSSCTRNEIADKAMYSEGVDKPKLVWIDPYEIARVALYHHQPTTLDRQADWSSNDNDFGKSDYVHGNHNGFNSEANEREGVLGYIDVRYWTPSDDPLGERGEIYRGGEPPSGWVRLKRKDGELDTSWAAELPGDISWVPGFVNDKYENLALTESWHGERSRLYRTDCQGCHAHNQPDRMPHYETFAGSDLYERPRFKTAKFVTFERDIEPLNLGISAEPWRKDANQQIHSLTSKLTDVDDNPNLTQTQAILVRQWIDTFMLRAGTINGRRITPEDKIGPYGDDVEPTVNVEFLADRICVGVADAQSGVDLNSERFTLDGKDVTAEFMFDAVEEIFTRMGKPPVSKEFVALVKDLHGNATQPERTVPADLPEPPAPPPTFEPFALDLGLGADVMGEFRDHEPDGRRDRVLKVRFPRTTPLADLVVMSTPQALDKGFHKHGIEAGGEAAWPPMGWVWAIEMEPVPNEPNTYFVHLAQPSFLPEWAPYAVFASYKADGSDTVRIPITVAPTPPDDVEALKARIAELEAQLQLTTAERDELAALKAHIHEETKP